MNLPENLVTLNQVLTAAQPGERIVVADVIARMTGLDLTRFDFEWLPNLMAFRITRRP